MCGSLFFAILSNFAAYLVIGARALYGVLPIGDVLLYAGSVTRAMSDLQTLAADVIVNIASHDRTRIAGFPDFLFNHFIKFLHILPAFSFHCTTKRPVWAIHCRYSPKILKDGQKTEDFSLHFVRLSTTYLLDSPFTEMMN